MPEWNLGAERQAPFWISDLNAGVTENFTACTLEDKDICIFEEQNQSRTVRKCVLHGIAVGGPLEWLTEPARETELWPAGRDGSPNYVPIWHWIAAIADWSCDDEDKDLLQRRIDERLIMQLALVLSGGRTKPAAIVRKYRTEAGTKSVSEHTEDLVAFLLGQPRQELIHTSVGMSKLIAWLEVRQKPSEPGNGSAWGDMALQYCRNRRLFRNKDGMLGLGPLVAKTGDEVYVVKGGLVPLVIRDGSTLAGECYLYGAMDGEFEDRVKSADGNTTVTLI